MEEVEGRPKAQKIPYRAKGTRRASTSDPATWSTFAEAMKRYERGGMTGIGFVFSHDDPFVGIDLDNVRCPVAHDTPLPGETTRDKEWAADVLRSLQSWTEVSHSQRGYHIIVEGSIPRALKDDAVGVEIYSTGRYFAITGERLPWLPETIEARQAALDALIRQFFPRGDQRQPPPAVAGDSFCAKVNGKALLALASWVPALFGDKARTYHDGYRVRSADLGRNLEEDISIVPAGIQDFGEERGKTAIDLVMEWGAPSTALDAALWLCSRIGADPETLGWRPARQQRPAAQPPPADPDYLAALGSAEAPGTDRHQPGDLTDTGNAARFAQQHGKDVRFVHEFGRWLVFDGHRWRPDHDGAVLRLARKTAQSWFADAAVADPKYTKIIADHARRSLSLKSLKALLELARSDGLTISQRDMDADPLLLGVDNGVIDLRTGEHGPGRRADLLSKALPVAYDPDAKCPRWMRFVSEVMGCNAALIGYLHRLIGYALTGKTTEQCFALFYGTGSNGKSTLLETLQALMGADYATTAAPDQLLARRNDRHPTELADLRGARLMVSVETGEGRKLNENLVKQVTGGDTVKARFMRQDFFTFSPTFKLILATNHKPAIKGTDHAIWRRIHLVPFTVTFDADQRDDDLSDTLRAELPGILNWAVAGCLAWQREGLNPPTEVIAATAEYRAQMDVLADFLADCCVTTNPRATAVKSDLYKAYARWCEDNGEHELSQRELSQRMSDRGFTETRIGKNRTRAWQGIGLKADVADDFTRAQADATDVADVNFRIDAYKGTYKRETGKQRPPRPQRPPADSDAYRMAKEGEL